MASPVIGSQDTCLVCRSPLSATLRHCPTCRADAGAPNVRRCRTEENQKALAARFDDAKTRASANGYLKEFCTLSDLIKKKSAVVVTMPAGLARKLFEDPNSLYKNYEELVGANVRKPADFDNDRQRCGTVAVLFGSYAKYIRYGALSLTQKGVPTYGDVHCRLKHVAIDKRTSFLETNSYRFVEEHNITTRGKLPAGYEACWEYRHFLVLAKLEDRLATGQTESDWQGILIHSDGKDRQNDDFVEAHIYDTFDGNAIESMVPVTERKLKRENRLDVRIAIAKFNSLGGKTK